VPLAISAGNLRGGSGLLLHGAKAKKAAPPIADAEKLASAGGADTDVDVESPIGKAEAIAVADSTMSTKKLIPENADEASADFVSAAAVVVDSNISDPKVDTADVVQDLENKNKKADEITDKTGSDSESEESSTGEEGGLEHYVNVVPINRVLPRRNPATMYTLEELEKQLKDRSAVRIAAAAVGFLVFLLSIMYCLHRQRGTVAAASKKF
jgi:hypothetical protein